MDALHDAEGIVVQPPPPPTFDSDDSGNHGPTMADVVSDLPPPVFDCEDNDGNAAVIVDEFPLYHEDISSSTAEQPVEPESPQRAQQQQPGSHENGVDTGAGGARPLKGAANSLVARLAARRMQLLAEPVLSDEANATIDATADALSELRVLVAAAAEAEAADRGEAPKPKHHRSETDPQREREADRAELGKQVKRLLKWKLTAEPWVDGGDAFLTEEGFVALVCALSVIRGQVLPLADARLDTTKVDEAAQQTYEELSQGSAVSPPEWRRKVTELLAVAAPPPTKPIAAQHVGSGPRNVAPLSASEIAHAATGQRGSGQPVTLPEVRVPITVRDFGFTAVELRAIENAHEAGFRDLVALQLYVFKNHVGIAKACDYLKLPISGIGRRDLYRIPRLLDRFRVDRSFDPVSVVHPNMPKTWDVACRLLGFVKIRYTTGVVNQVEEHIGYACVVTDLRGNPVYTGNAIRRTEREAWEAAYKEAHGSHWFTPPKQQYLIGPPQLAGINRIMCINTAANTPQAIQQNSMLARLMRPVADLVDHIETFKILRESHNMDPLVLLGVVRYVAHAHAVASRTSRH